MTRIALWTIRYPFNTLTNRIFVYSDPVPFPVIFNYIIRFKRIIKRIMFNERVCQRKIKKKQTKEEAKGLTFM